MGDLTKNFSRWEFQCKHCGIYMPPPADFVASLQRLRDIVGAPLNMLNTYRCPYYNRRVGGSPNSQHLHANAADIPGTYATLAQVKEAGFGRIGVRAGRVIHVDNWPGYRNRVFNDRAR